MAPDSDLPRALLQRRSVNMPDPTDPESEGLFEGEWQELSEDPEEQEPDNPTSMSREELKSHLTANEERVRRMTEGVSQKLDKHLEVLQESNERFKAEVREDLATIKESNKWSYRLSAATLTVLIIVVGLMGLLLN